MWYRPSAGAAVAGAASRSVHLTAVRPGRVKLGSWCLSPACRRTFACIVATLVRAPTVPELSRFIITFCAWIDRGAVRGQALRGGAQMVAGSIVFVWLWRPVCAWWWSILRRADLASRALFAGAARVLSLAICFRLCRVL